MASIDPFINLDILQQFYCYLNIGERISPMYSIPGEMAILDGEYFISDYGRVFSIVKGYVAELKPSLNNDGYYQINLPDGLGKRTIYRINRLVAIYFLPYQSGFRNLEVHHKDDNKLNNYYLNLQWVTHEEHDKITAQSLAMPAILKPDDVKQIRKELYLETSTIRQLAKRYGVTDGTIYYAAKGKTFEFVKTKYDGLIKFAKEVDDEDIKIFHEIYHLCCTTNMSDRDLGIKYGFSKTKIGAIRHKLPPYDKYLADVTEDANVNNFIPKRSVSDEDAIKIWELTVKKEIPVNKVYNLFGGKYGKYVLNEIKFLRGEYYRLREEYNLYPAEPKINNSIDKQKARDARKMLENGSSNKEVQEALKLGESTVTDIKLCRRGFKWLLDEGYEPLEPANNRVNTNIK